MKLSYKLDQLHRLAVQYARDPNRLCLIELLAEHADENEITADFLTWLETILQ